MNGTRQKTLSEQLSQTMVTEGRGEALDAESKEAEPLVAKPAPESPAVTEQLMEEVQPRESRKSVETRSTEQGQSWRGWDDHRRRQGLPA